MPWVLREYGEEPEAKRIAASIVRSRPLFTTADLGEAVRVALPRRPREDHPATLTFQAIRIFLNRELEEIEAALPQALEVLRPGGRLAVISFHSLEDRRVKRIMRRESQDHPAWAGMTAVPPEARARLALVGKAVFPSEAECARNPRARSAVLRVAERLAA